MASVGVKVFGERRLSEQLEGIQKAMATEIAREATDQAAQILQAAARQNLNVRSGKGRQSVKRRRAKRTMTRPPRKSTATTASCARTATTRLIWSTGSERGPAVSSTNTPGWSRRLIRCFRRWSPKCSRSSALVFS